MFGLRLTRQSAKSMQNEGLASQKHVNHFHIIVFDFITELDVLDTV